MGIRGRVSRSTLADANETHDWRIYADFAVVLIERARHLYASDPFGAEVEQVAYALDSTTIDLCLAMFPWAQFRKTKGAVKMHTLIDLRGNIPTFIRISTGKVHDVNILDELVAEPGAFYIMDRGYVDFERLYRLTKRAAFFVTRTKDNIKLQRRYSHPLVVGTNVRSDQTVVAATAESWLHYPTPLRRIRFYDDKHQRFLIFLTNNFDLPALTIANLYRCRWQVELFFKWIKQHLRVKAFYGTSLNAVSTQIWIGITIYLLLAIVKKELVLEASLYQILQVASVSILDKTPILRAFQPEDNQDDFQAFSNQLKLFDL